jgi:hypothetical protein
MLLPRTTRHLAAWAVPPSAVALRAVVRRRSPFPMRIAFLVFAIGVAILRADAADFARLSTFESVEAFIATATALQPATTQSDLSALFTVRELGQPEDPKTDSPITATSIASSVSLWSNDSYALVFVTAAPPTEATRSAVGVLFFLSRTKGSWRIADSQRFTTTGKDAGVSAELTAGTGTGYHLGSDAMNPVVTVKESHGGRGYSYQSSASYTLSASKLKRLELE